MFPDKDKSPKLYSIFSDFDEFNPKKVVLKDQNVYKKLRKNVRLNWHQSSHGDYITVFGANKSDFEIICKNISANILEIAYCTFDDLSDLRFIRGLKNLKIHSNTKLRTLESIQKLSDLDTVFVSDVPKIDDLSPISSLKNISTFGICGGMHASIKLKSLEPLSQLEKLKEFYIVSARVLEGGLRPLKKCRSLKHLSVSNQFKTEDYAYLLAIRPDIICEHLAPYVCIEGSNIAPGIDRMIVGSRKPFLSSARDGERIRRYEEKFYNIVDKIRSEANEV